MGGKKVVMGRNKVVMGGKKVVMGRNKVVMGGKTVVMGGKKIVMRQKKVVVTPMGHRRIRRGPCPDSNTFASM